MRSVLLSLAVIIFGAHTPICGAAEVMAAIRAPVRCSAFPSCGATLSLNEAKASYNKEGRVLLERRPPAATAPFPGGLLFNNSVGAATSRNICNSDDVLGDYYFWAPLEQIPNGQKAFDKLKETLESGTSDDSYLAIEAAHSSTLEQHFALCNVSTVNGVSGPPKDCATVAIKTPSETWMRAGIPMQGSCMLAGSFRPSGAMEVQFHIRTGRSPEDFLASLMNVLQEDLSLQVQTSLERTSDGLLTSALLRSTSGIRNSRVLQSGWREALDFDLSISQRSGFVEIYGAAHALVSRLAVGRLAEYSGLDDGQRTIYVSKLNDLVEKAIKQTCTYFRRVDSKNLECLKG